MPPFKRTKIVATLGPATDDKEVIRALAEAGADVFRLNFSHGAPEDHRRRVGWVREVAEELGRTLAVLQDLQGPKIRVGRFREGQVLLRPGQRFVLTAEPVEGDEHRVSVSYKGLPEDVSPGQILLLDDGRIRLKVLEVRSPEILTEVEVGGVLSNNKGINIPGADLSIPALSEKDIQDLALGAELGVDWVAVSFVRTRDDLLLARHYLSRYGSKARLMAKIEKPSAVARFEEILEEADGIMVARGDLGVEMPLEEVPIVQKRLILRCIAAGKPVITATQMLESMVQNPSPTRAEASDVANAIFDGTDAVMLSAETAAGAYPVEAVAMMARIAKAVESSPEFLQKLNVLSPRPHPHHPGRHRPGGGRRGGGGGGPGHRGLHGHGRLGAEDRPHPAPGAHPGPHPEPRGAEPAGLGLGGLPPSRPRPPGHRRHGPHRPQGGEGPGARPGGGPGGHRRRGSLRGPGDDEPHPRGAGGVATGAG